VKPDYLIATLLKKPVLLTLRFNPDEYVIDLDTAKEQSTVPFHAANAGVVFGGLWDDPEDDDKAFAYNDGIAVIPITGVLLNRFSYSFSMATGYNAVRSQLQTALADPAVKGIVFDVNSPGGMVQGCMELADEIYAARGTKPMLAVVDANCTSAAYALASAADQIAATRSADIGSIGVLCMHVDLSGALAQDGVDVTFIYAGSHKVDGNPYQPLPKGVKADLQASIDSTYQEFVSLVARNRGMDAQAVRDTEAQVYGAQDAMNLGLIDSVATPAEAITAFRSSLSGSLNIGDYAMTEKVVQPGSTQAAPDNTVILATAAAQAATAERARIHAIMTSEEAQGRRKLATHLALSSDITPEAAKAILLASPMKGPKKDKEAKSDAAVGAVGAVPNAFADAMAKNNPNVSAGSDTPAEVDPVTRILANFAQASGNRKTA